MECGNIGLLHFWLEGAGRRKQNWGQICSSRKLSYSGEALSGSCYDYFLFHYLTLYIVKMHKDMGGNTTKEVMCNKAIDVVNSEKSDNNEQQFSLKSNDSK